MRVLSWLFALLGLVVLIGSIWFTAIQGNQIATIGVGLVLFAMYMRLSVRRRK